MLKRWNPKNLVNMKPFITAMCGNRRSGKSTLQAHLLEEHLSKEFDLIISFAGSVSCSPEVVGFFQKRGKAHLMFDSINENFIRTLCAQQEALKQQGITRSVLLLLDDVEMDKHLQMIFGNFSQRARHYNISIMIAAVSYTSVSKNYRRSLDIVFFFKLNMTSDKKLLLDEFTSNRRFSEFCMEDLQQYHCLVQEKNYASELFIYSVENEEEKNQDPVQCSEEMVISAETDNTGLEQASQSSNEESEETADV